LLRFRPTLDVLVADGIAWIGVTLATMLMTWVWPRTFIGLLLAFTVLPAAGLALQGLVRAVSESGPIVRFHAWLGQRTRAKRISALRIFVCLSESLIFGGILITLVFGIGWAAGVQTGTLEAFMDRHFWP